MSLVTPLHFSFVQPNFYRGSYPREINFPFLRTLNLKYILSLTPDPLDKDLGISKFCTENGIKMIHIECSKETKDKTKPKVKRKKKTVPIEYGVLHECIKFLIDGRNYPCYMHCMNGELVTSLVVACLRKFSYWGTVSILNEFLAYNSSINIHERSFIEDFNSEIEIDGLLLQDKVPWIAIQHVASQKQDECKKEIEITKVSSSKNMLPKLKFHSL
ncbi:hypothetical protein HG535_0B01370 [Zygotorulaspora mrakii]|uniref:Tyrosine-protein phosphatase domain-containing protein n=1 Tax=Zygotorulaspora mrakii TaxID=42260 RepID=A0A7H9AZG3_ZYGMR|nr:uncharacterized protein HG535_0B01370 [Zygotorulaspora mrakii]QLG71099.1 hypothetical protein HG535_0B01370 [Zygotorulaspora mrakii]